MRRLVGEMDSRWVAREGIRLQRRKGSVKDRRRGKRKQAHVEESGERLNHSKVVERNLVQRKGY